MLPRRWRVLANCWALPSTRALHNSASHPPLPLLLPETPIHIAQSYSFVKHASPAGLAASQALLQREVPHRIVNLASRLLEFLRGSSSAQLRGGRDAGHWRASSAALQGLLQEQHAPALEQHAAQHALRCLAALESWSREQQQQQQEPVPATDSRGSRAETLDEQLARQQAAFALSLSGLKDACEASLHTLTYACQQLASQQQHQQHHHQQQQQLNALLDLCNHQQLALRLLTAQHMAAWHSIAPQQLRPPHVGPPGSSPHPNLVDPRCLLLEELSMTAEDCRWAHTGLARLCSCASWVPLRAWPLQPLPQHSCLPAAARAIAAAPPPGAASSAPSSARPPAAPLRRRRAHCIEKNSTAPPLEVAGDASLRGCVVLPYLQYLVTEVLKNGMQVGGWGGPGLLGAVGCWAAGMAGLLGLLGCWGCWLARAACRPCASRCGWQNSLPSARLPFQPRR
jgi:hypothetical protein